MPVDPQPSLLGIKYNLAHGFFERLVDLRDTEWLPSQRLPEAKQSPVDERRDLRVALHPERLQFRFGSLKRYFLLPQPLSQKFALLHDQLISDACCFLSDVINYCLQVRNLGINVLPFRCALEHTR